MNAWNTNAELRHQQIVSGMDLSYSLVLGPAIKEALGKPTKGSRLLDAGCGSGVLTGELQAIGWSATGIDVSPEMIAVARRNARLANSPEFFTMDMVNVAGEFPKEHFDAIVAHMSITGIEQLSPIFRAFRLCLKPRGKVIITDVHPWFWRLYKNQDVSYWQTATRLEPFSVSLFPEVLPEPTPVVYRPLQALVESLFEAGFAIDALKEPRPSKKDEALYPSKWPYPRFILIRAILAE